VDSLGLRLEDLEERLGTSMSYRKYAISFILKLLMAQRARSFMKAQAPGFIKTILLKVHQEEA
jgi:hypothetical protein